MTEGPYKLPKGWRWVRLGEVCRYDRRTVDPRRFPGRTFYLYSIPAYDKGQIPEKLDGSQIGSSKVVLEPGVCLFSKLNPRIPRAWVVAEAPQDGVPVASTEFMPLRPNAEVLDLNYLANLLVAEAFLSQVQQVVTGATGSRQRLKPETILNTAIPLPPLEEQRRIVARIEELMARVREARRLREQAREDAERLWQAVLAETFPRPGSDLPAGWRWVRLGEVAKVRYGKAKPRGQNGSVPVIGSGGAYDTTKEPLVTFPTVVIGRKGSAGEAILVREQCWPSDTTFYLDWISDVEPSWVWLWLILHKPSPSGTTATLPSVRREDLERHLIPLPPLDEQRRIVAYLQAVQEKVKALKEVQAQTDEDLRRLERVILDRAFRGEL